MHYVTQKPFMLHTMKTELSRFCPIFYFFYTDATSTCTATQFSCGNNICISRSQVCNGRNDCADRRDELNCPSCLSTEFDCGNNICIPNTQVCDGTNNCADGRDESSTRCFTCQNGDKISIFDRCDSTNDCADNTDEFGCGTII